MSYESEVTTSPVFDRPAKIVYPFSEDGDNSTKEVHQPLYQLADRYVPPTLGAVFVPATDANFSGSPVSIGSAYCIGDYDLTEAESGLVSFTRKWSNIPATRTVPIGSTLYQMVGLTGGVVGTVKTITAVSSSANSSTYSCAAHGYSPGNMVFLALNFYRGSAINSHFIYAPYKIASVTTDTFTISGQSFTGATFTSGTCQSGDIFRATRQVKTTGYNKYEYALPGVTSGISSSGDFVEDKTFNPVVTATGQSIADYEELGNVLSPTTSPTDSEYRSMIKDGTLLVAESNISTYKGNILQRATLMVRAM
jgi:hypothetical protein